MARSARITTTILAVLLLSACTGGPGSDSAGSDGGAGGGMEVPGAAAPEVADDVAADTDEDRQVVTTASASLVVDDPARGAQQVSELVDAAGGRVEERTERVGSGDEDAGDAEDAYADLVVRVPADELTEVLADLADVGEVASVSISRSDVTATAVDLDARIAALRTSVARLLALIDRADTTEALLAAEKALAERQGELDSLQSRRDLLADQVEMSTLAVHLRPQGVAPAGGPDGFGEGLATGWRALVSALGAAAVVLGVVLPWLVVAAVLAVAVLVPFRLARRRAAAPAAPPQD